MDVLVVDDEADIRALLDLYLRGRGHAVTLVGDAAAARRACRDHDFDAALVDLGLPDADGADLVRSLRDAGRLPDRTALLSALRPSELAERASDLGLPAVSKPFTVADLDTGLGPLLAG